MTTTETATKKPGPNLWLSIFVFALGAVLTTAGVALLGSSLLGAVTEDAFDIPGGEERSLEPGEFDVYVSSGDFFAPLDDVAAATRDITVTNLDTGENVPVSEIDFVLTVGRGQTNFVAIGTFEVVEAGNYQIAIASEVGGLALVSKSLPNSFAEVRYQVIMMVAGLIIGLIGAAMIVFGMVRRSKAKRAAATEVQHQQGVVPGQFQPPPAATQAPAASPPPASSAATGPPPAPGPNEPPTTISDSATPWDT